MSSCSTLGRLSVVCCDYETMHAGMHQSSETYHRKNTGYFDEVQKQQENKLKQPLQIRY